MQKCLGVVAQRTLCIAMLVFLPSEMSCLFFFGLLRKSRGNGRVPATKSKDQPATINDEPETSNDVVHKPCRRVTREWIEKKLKSHSWLHFDIRNVCPSFLSLNIASSEAESIAAIVFGQTPSLLCFFFFFFFFII